MIASQFFFIWLSVTTEQQQSRDFKMFVDLNMEESYIFSKFDNLIKSGAVRYDEKQRRIEHVDEDLHVSIVSPFIREGVFILTIRIIVLFRYYLCSRQ